MKILLTGSEGNIGGRLFSYLKYKGYDVYGMDHKQGFKEHYSVADIKNPLDLIPVFNNFRPDIVFHLAAMVSRVTCEASPSTTIETNIAGTNNIAQLCKQYNSKLINFSTSEVYGNIGGLLSEDRYDLAPNNIYGLSKLLAEKIVNYERTNGLRAINVRPFMFYDEEETLGEHRSAMIRFCENLLNKEPIVVHKNSTRAWLHINDGVKILERIMYSDNFPTINVGNPETIETKYLAEYICKELGLSYDQYVKETELPERMTLEKKADLSRQSTVAPIEFEYPIERGIRLVLDRVKTRLRQ